MALLSLCSIRLMILNGCATFRLQTPRSFYVYSGPRVDVQSLLTKLATLLGAITPSCKEPQRAGDIGGTLYISYLSAACKLPQPLEISADICFSSRLASQMERYMRTSGTGPSCLPVTSLKKETTFTAPDSGS
jgi:hypothetical protein